MSEEEKESAKLETLIELLYTDRLSQYGKRKLVKYIEEQQKEIEELKKPKYLAHFENNKITKIELINDYISKDKIREKIKELEKAIDQNKIMSIQVRQHGFSQKTIEQYVIRAIVEILEELLEEN